MLGALLELQRAVWAPVVSRGRLRGVLLAGTRRKHGVLPLARVEAVSVELALALELEEERRLARQRQADLTVVNRLLAELASSGAVDSIFTRLVDGCTETAPGGDGLGAVFAILRTQPAFGFGSEPELPDSFVSERIFAGINPTSRSVLHRAVLAERRCGVVARDGRCTAGEYLASGGRCTRRNRN
jgi:hypothetical protein